MATPPLVPEVAAAPSVPLAVLAAADEHRERVALVDAGTGLAATYAELATLVTGRAARLQRHGVRAGDVVAYRPPREGIDAVGTLLALGLTGAATLVVAPHLPESLAATLEDAAAPTVLLRDRLTRRSDPRRGWADGTWLLVPTSGSTGTPRLVRLTHAGLLAAAQVYLDRVPLSAGDPTAVVLSLGTVGALPSAALPALLTGGRAFLCTGSSPRAFVDILRRERVAFATSYTAWWETCLAVPEFADLPALRVLASGGAPWQPLVPALAARLPRTRVLGIYGLSQTHGPGVHAWGEDLLRRQGTAGRAADGLEVRTDGDGQILLRGRLLSPGYVDGPLERDADGWFATGDLGVLEDGWLSVTGRVDDVLNLGGRKVHPAQVEAVLAAHAAVAQVAVVRVAATAYEPAHLAAHVVLSGHASTAELRAWARERLGAYAAPRAVVFHPTLPLTPAGKVDRVALAALRPSAPPSP